MTETIKIYFSLYSAGFVSICLEIWNVDTVPTLCMQINFLFILLIPFGFTSTILQIHIMVSKRYLFIIYICVFRIIFIEYKELLYEIKHQLRKIMMSIVRNVGFCHTSSHPHNLRELSMLNERNWWKWTEKKESKQNQRKNGRNIARHYRIHYDYFDNGIFLLTRQKIYHVNMVQLVYCMSGIIIIFHNKIRNLCFMYAVSLSLCPVLMLCILNDDCDGSSGNNSRTRRIACHVLWHVSSCVKCFV